MANSPLLSVVVCTYSRDQLLKQALESLCLQALPKDRFEIIVVDNNSFDDTRSVVERCSDRYNNVRYCFEAAQGLSHARNRGWQEARGRYVGYFDDDSVASPQWLEVAARIIKEHNPLIFGGPYYAWYDRPKPKWFKDQYGSHDLGTEPRVLRKDEFVSGTNIFIRRDLFSELGGFQPQLGMRGSVLGYGEETMFFIEARKRIPGLSIYYDPDLYVFHLVAAHKMSLRKTAYRSVISGRYSHRVFSGYGKSSNGRALRSFAKFVVRGMNFLADWAVGCIWRNRTAYPFWQNYVYEHSFEFLEKVGAGYEEFITSIRRD